MSGPSKLLQSSKHDNGHWDEQPSNSVDNGREPSGSDDEDTGIQYDGAGISDGAVSSYNLPCLSPTHF